MQIEEPFSILALDQLCERAAFHVQSSLLAPRDDALPPALGFATAAGVHS